MSETENLEQDASGEDTQQPTAPLVAPVSTPIPDDISLAQICEGALLAAAKPMTVSQLGELFDDDVRPDNDSLRQALQELADSCEGRGFELREVASGFRLQVRQQLSPWVARLWQERPQKYSRALLETLALIAYRQPITRGEIEEIRGVAVSSNIIKTLHEREWVRVVGHRDVPGRPAMYATTRQFLDYFNLKTLDQLPALAEIRDLETLTAELGFTDLDVSADKPAANDDTAGEAMSEDVETASEPGDENPIEGDIEASSNEIDADSLEAPEEHIAEIDPDRPDSEVS